MKSLFILLAVLLASNLYCQKTDTLSLDNCQALARTNYPLLKQKDLLSSASALKLNNIGVNYYPKISLNGQATYQSDVTKIPVSIPGLTIPEVKKDMYKADFSINEMIYDGGLTRGQHNLEIASNKADLENVEVDLYQIKDRINQLYFNVLTLKKNAEILELGRDDLTSRLHNIESAIKNGVMTASGLDVIRVEILRLDEQILEINYSRENVLDMLGIYIGRVIPENIVLKVPDTNKYNSTDKIERREFALFELQKQKLEVSKSIVDAENLPRISAFAELGYGRPALNMLSDHFQTYYYTGLRLSWSPWNWQQNNREKKLLDLQKEIIDNQKDVFGRNLRLSLNKYYYQDRMYLDFIKKDQEILKLQANILNEANSQLQNGAITASDYLEDKNAELQARLNLETHKLQWLKNRIDFQTALGKF